MTDVQDGRRWRRNGVINGTTEDERWCGEIMYYVQIRSKWTHRILTPSASAQTLWRDQIEKVTMRVKRHILLLTNQCTIWNLMFKVLIKYVIALYDPTLFRIQIRYVPLFAPLLSGVNSFRILQQSISTNTLYSFLQYESEKPTKCVTQSYVWDTYSAY